MILKNSINLIKIFNKVLFTIIFYNILCCHLESIICLKLLAVH